MQNDRQIISDILDREGEEFTDHPADRGGPTKWGVTLDTFRAYRKALAPQFGADPNPSTDQLIAWLKDLSRGEASDILEHLYLTGPGFHLVSNTTLRALLVDSGVQHGTKTTIRMLQHVLDAGRNKVRIDGILGPETLNVIDRQPTAQIYVGILAARCRLYGSIISRDPKLVAAKLAGYRLQAENAAGWANRLATFIEDTDLL